MLQAAFSPQAAARHGCSLPCRTLSGCNRRYVPWGCKPHARRTVVVKADEKPEEGGQDFNEQREKLDKLSKISGGQYLFNRVREKAEQKVGRVISKSREDYLEYEKQEFLRTAPSTTLDANAPLTAPIWALRSFIQAVLMKIIEWPLITLVRAVAAVAAGLQSKINNEQFEMFMMSEGEKIWRWRNRSHNERWFWQFFLFRSLLPTVLGIVVYEAFVPNNIVWAVVVPYAFYWTALEVHLNPFMFDWWLVMYFGFYAKCWPAIALALQTFFLG